MHQIKWFIYIVNWSWTNLTPRNQMVHSFWHSETLWHITIDNILTINASLMDDWWWMIEHIEQNASLNCPVWFFLGCKIAVVVKSFAGGEHWLRQVAMNLGKSCHWMHFVSRQCKSIHSLFQLVYWYDEFVKCFDQVDEVGNFLYIWHNDDF